MSAQFYIYILFRPWDGSPCYVGKGKGVRYLDHARKGLNHPNRRLAQIIAQAGGGVPAVIVRDGLEEDTAFAYERVFIAAIGRGKYGPLVNATAGGQGTAGHTHSEATRRKMSERRLGKQRPEIRGRPAWNKGIKQSAGQIEKTIASWTSERRAAQTERLKKTGHRPSLEACRNGGLAMKGRKTGPNKSRGVPKTMEYRAAISAGLIGRKNPHKGVPRSPECRAKISATKRAAAALAALA